MIPFPNVVAGILIGIVSDTWLVIFIAPFGWGISFCVYAWIARKEELELYIARQESRSKRLKFGMSPITPFSLY